MIQKLFLNPRCRYWCENFNPPPNDIWNLTKTIGEADHVISIDYPILFQTNKKKIVFLVEPENIFQTAYQYTYEKLFSVTNSYDIIITHHKKYVDNKKIFFSPPPFQAWVKEKNIFPKTKLCSMITSRKNMVPEHTKRIQTAEKFASKLNLYGHGYWSLDSKNEGLNDYCFSIAMENYSTPGYYTEKILDCFLTGTVPIYFGDPDIGDVYDTRGIIRLNDDFTPENLSFDLYNQMMPYVINNFKIALENYNKDYNSVPSFISSGVLKI